MNPYSACTIWKVSAACTLPLNELQRPQLDRQREFGERRRSTRHFAKLPTADLVELSRELSPGRASRASWCFGGETDGAGAPSVEPEEAALAAETECGSSAERAIRQLQSIIKRGTFMSTIGRIQRRTTKSGDMLEGYVYTLLYNFRFKLIPAPSSQNPNAPRYHIITRNNAGIDVVIGAAWVKVIKRGSKEGEEFLTLTFDDPSFPKSLNVAAFKNADGGDYDVTFRRRQDKAI